MDNDLDERQYRTPLMTYVESDSATQPNGGDGGRIKNKVPAEPRPEFGVAVIEESGLGITKDITVVHSDWKSGKKGPGVELYIPGPKREAVAWQAAHTYFAYDGAEMFVCNICGKDLKLSGTAGAISSHLKRKHPGIREKMEEVERKNLKKRKRTDLMASPPKAKMPMLQSTVENSTKFGPVARDIQAPQKIAVKSQVAQAKKIGIQRSIERKAYTIQAQKQAQIMYFIGEGLSFSHFESYWHNNLLETTVAASKTGGGLHHLLEISRTDVSKRVFVASQKLREHLKEKIKVKDLSAATNHWTSRQRVTYASFSVQWIEEFRLQSAVLAVYVLKGIGETSIHNDIMRDIATKLDYWGFGSSIKFLVSDRLHSDADAFRLSIEKLPNTTKLPCLDDSLNLVAKKAFEGALGVKPGEDFGEFDDAEGFDNLDYVDDEDDINGDKKSVSRKALLPKVRKLVSHFESSIQASDELMLIAKQLCASEEEREALKHLAQDVSTNWWSTQNMLERLFGLREAITTYVARKWMAGATSRENRPPRLTENEWEALEELHFMIRPLRFAHQMLQDLRSISSASFVPLVVHLIYHELETIHKEDSNNTSVKTIAREMLDKMDELFGNFASRDSSASTEDDLSETEDQAKHSYVKIPKAILMAHALDPRFKPLSVFPAQVQDKIWSDILDEMLLLGPIMSSTNKDSAVGNEDDGNKSDKGDRKRFRCSDTSEINNLLEQYGSQRPNRIGRSRAKIESSDFDADNWKRACEIELRQYRETVGMEPKMNSDVIHQWWGDDSRANMYPVLWRLARRVLILNATSTPAHRAFSLDENIAIHNRCKMGKGDDYLHFLYENCERLKEGMWNGEEPM